MHNEHDQKTSPRVYTRREVISRVVTTSALMVSTTGLGAFLASRHSPAGTKYEEIRDHRTSSSPGSIDMAIARGPDPGANVRAVINALGGMGRFINKGERVLIKPNAGWNRLPEQAANTNPEVIAEIIRFVTKAGASEVWVADVSVNKPERCFARSGLQKATQDNGARLILPDSGGFRLVGLKGQLLREAEVFWPFIKADRIINVPIVKHHGLTGASMAMKNWYGVLGGHRVRLHQRIDQAITDLAIMMKPTLTVLDGTRVMMHNGPSGGSLDDVKRCDTIAAGIDEVALDAFGATLLERSPDELSFIAVGEKAGLGRSDYKSLKLVETSG
ncbi:MAG: DUF362 domain-containing protein [Deltaproteobacteria bacterium]|nr:DUF362 domain-containing protein [Deltaproteobacteria bacterium]